MLQNHFNIKRFYNALRYDLSINAKTYGLFLLSFLLGLLLFDLFFILERASKFTSTNYTPLFYLTFIIGIVVVVGTSFPQLRNKKSTINYLTFPISTFEKFLLQFGIRIFAFMILFIPLFWLEFKLADIIYNLFEWRNYVKIDSFTLFEPILFDKRLEPLDIFTIIASLFSLAAFLFAGTTYFKKKAFPKTIFSFALFGLFVFLLFVLNTSIFYIDRFSLKDKIVYFNDYKISENLWNIQLFFYAIGIASSLFLLPLAYFKLKEKEI